MYTIERQSASQETTTEGLEERERIDKEIVAMLAIYIQRSTGLCASCFHYMIKTHI